MASLIFPSTSVQILSSLIHFLGLSVLTHCLSRRVATEELTSFEGLSQISWPRLCILLVFLDSWLFLFLSGVLIFGVGLETHHAICSSAIYLCIAFYATSKILIYAFLIERVHIVWSPSTGIKRFKSRVYVICFMTVALYAVIITLMLVGRIHYFREDGACVVGLKPLSSIPLLSYDLYINVFLTVLFLWPLLKSNHINARVKKVATHTLIASGIALTTSTANMLALTILHGQELGWVCLGSCGVDVIFNALALFWATGGSGMRTRPSSPGPSKSGPKVDGRLGDPTTKPPRVHVSDTSPWQNTPAQTQLSQQHLQRALSVYDHLPDTPFSASSFTPQSSRYPESNPNLEREIQSATKAKPSVLNSVAGLFRKKSVNPEEHGLQITVTTQVELDISAEDFDSPIS